MSNEVRTTARPIAVWAPSAKQVELERNGCKTSLRRESSGWWTAPAFTQVPGDYRFCIDGGAPLPDPRSPCQPAGVHGPSRSVDHAEFVWTDRGFRAPPLSSAIIYELHIGTFTPEGTFDSAISRLDALLDLGVTHVELMPVAQFPGAYGWGYDGVDLFAPYHGYGGPDGLKRLVDACHARGLATILDVVYNHLGPQGNYLGKFGPYYSGRQDTPWGASLNFDGPHSDEVRRFFIDNALMWLRDYHFDGLRLDAVQAIADITATHFLEQLATEVNELQAHLGRHLVLIAENDTNDPRLVRRPEAGGFGLDAQWSDDFHHALHAAITGERVRYYVDFGALRDLARTFEQPFLFDGRHSAFRGRRHGRAPLGVSGHHFLAYIQNHDQVGNRARGERLTHVTTPERCRIAAGLVLMSPYVPMLFQGEEWGATTPFLFFADHRDDPGLARAISAGRKRELESCGWSGNAPNPCAPVTFQCSKLNWEERALAPHASMLDWYKQLIAVRRTYPELTNGRLDLVRTECNEAEQWLSIERGGVTIQANFSSHPRRVPMGENRFGRVVLCSGSLPPVLEDGHVILPRETFSVLHRD